MMNNWTADFPILAADENGNRLVYLDSAATTQHPKQVLDAVVNYYNKDNANPHRGVYELAMRATLAIRWPSSLTPKMTRSSLPRTPPRR